MRPFDIELWKAGEPVVTRDGREVKELTYFRTKKGIWKVYGTVDGELNAWNDAGSSLSNTESHLDLFHPESEMWVNVYNRGGIIVADDIYFTEIDSKKSIYILSKDKYIGTYKLIKP